MKTILLVAGSRAGVEFFQSLLEGHTQILQFPGIIQTNNNDGWEQWSWPSCVEIQKFCQDEIDKTIRAKGDIDPAAVAKKCCDKWNVSFYSH